MSGCRVPGSVCSTASAALDEGTSSLMRTPPPGPIGVSAAAGSPATGRDQFLYSPGVKVVIDVPMSIAPGMTWDAFWRLIYDRANEGLQRQANELLKQGRITVEESRALVDARNALLLRIRSRLTPFGELYSELLKPSSSLRSLEQIRAEKGTIEAVLKSVGKTRAVVDKIGVVSRFAGPAAIVLDVSMTAFVIQQASPEQRNRVGAREIGGLVGSVGGGLGGMWAGCASAGLLASPSLVLPVVGEVTTAGACFAGGLLGGLGIGWLGRKAGEAVGDEVYRISNEVSEFRWVAAR
ncbi:MAG: hypothetical protein M3Z15_00175 [Pseudomonadota bacterium]|nr:hypothetical protein [Pseudomonadota bacterium]